MQSEKSAQTVNEFCSSHAIGRSKFYEEVKAGRIKLKKGLPECRETNTAFLRPRSGKDRR